MREIDNVKILFPKVYEPNYKQSFKTKLSVIKALVLLETLVQSKAIYTYICFINYKLFYKSYKPIYFATL